MGPVRERLEAELMKSERESFLGNDGYPFSVFSSDSLVPMGVAVADLLPIRTASRFPSVIRDLRLAKGGGGRPRGERVGMSIIIGSSGPPRLQNVQKVFLSERIETKPGDLKLFVIGVIKGTWPITKPSQAKAEDGLSAIQCSGSGISSN